MSILSWIHFALNIPITYVFKSNKYDNHGISLTWKKTQSYLSLPILCECSRKLNMKRFGLHNEAVGSKREGLRLLIMLNSAYHQFLSTYYRDRFATRTQECLLNKWKKEIVSLGTYACATYYVWLTVIWLLPLPRWREMGWEGAGSLIIIKQRFIEYHLCARKEVKLKVITVLSNL